MPLINIIIAFFSGSAFLQKLLIYVAGASSLFLFGVYEGHSWTKAYDAAQYEKAKQAELTHQAQVEAEFRVKEQALIDKEKQLNDQLDTIKNETAQDPNGAVPCLPATGVRRLNEIR